MVNEAKASADGDEYERKHVHQVYSKIAPHFSQTRHKPWPLISKFLLSLPAGSIGIDVGCGNGKYMDVNPAIWILGSDRSEELARIAKTEKGGHRFADAIVGDALDLPHQAGRFDFAICIAVIHHLSTRERRIEGIRALLDILVPDGGDREPGRALIYVWALEQKSSRRGWDEGDKQDVMVPWVMKRREKNEGQANEQTFNRYYHLYRAGELEEDVVQAEGRVLDSGYEKDNWWAIASQQATTQNALNS